MCTVFTAFLYFLLPNSWPFWNYCYYKHRYVCLYYDILNTDKLNDYVNINW